MKKFVSMVIVIMGVLIPMICWGWSNTAPTSTISSIVISPTDVIGPFMTGNSFTVKVTVSGVADSGSEGGKVTFNGVTIQADTNNVATFSCSGSDLGLNLSTTGVQTASAMASIVRNNYGGSVSATGTASVTVRDVWYANSQLMSNYNSGTWNPGNRTWYGGTYQTVNTTINYGPESTASLLSITASCDSNKATFTRGALSSGQGNRSLVGVLDPCPEGITDCGSGGSTTIETAQLSVTGGGWKQSLLGGVLSSPIHVP